jgi:mannose-6-phosphate isomerase-like protein (cupin superfamily)
MKDSNVKDDVSENLYVACGLQEEFYIDEGCYITELSNTDNDPDVSIARARVEVGKTTKWHKLNGITERYVIVAGEGVVEIGNLLPQKVEMGDVVVISPMIRQRIANIGDNDLIFLAICSPRFQQSAYLDDE